MLTYRKWCDLYHASREKPSRLYPSELVRLWRSGVSPRDAARVNDNKVTK